MKENDWAGRITTMRGKYMKKGRKQEISASQSYLSVKIQSLQVLVAKN
jgi:hypothetical protein